MEKFIILYSPNKSNIGTVCQHSAGYFNPNKKQVTETELEDFKAMSDVLKRVWIEEALKANGENPQVEKKSVEDVIKAAEPELVEEIVEVPTIEESNEVETIELPSEDESIAEITESKKKGRPVKK